MCGAHGLPGSEGGSCRAPAKWLELQQGQTEDECWNIGRVTSGMIARATASDEICRQHLPCLSRQAQVLRKSGRPAGDGLGLERCVAQGCIETDTEIRHSTGIAGIPPPGRLPMATAIAVWVRACRSGNIVELATATRKTPRHLRKEIDKARSVIEIRSEGITKIETASDDKSHQGHRHQI